MHIQSLKGNPRRSRVKILIFQLADLSAIDRIPPIAAELLDIEIIRSLPDLLIRRKGDPHLTMPHLGMIFQITHSGDNRSHASLVIRAKQGRAIGHDNILPLVIRELREHRRREHDILALIQHDITSRVSHDTRTDVLARHIGAGIQMGDQTDHRPLSVHIRGKSRHQIATLVQRYILHAYLFQLLYQRFRENPLPRRARCRAGLLARLRIEGHVPQKSI